MYGICIIVLFYWFHKKIYKKKQMAEAEVESFWQRQRLAEAEVKNLM